MSENELKNIPIKKEELTKAEKKEIKNEVKEILKKEEAEKKDTSIKPELTKAEKIASFFDKIEFLSMENDQKELVALKVKSDSLWDKLYWIEIFLSSTIAALWLLQNSVAVVIWAMLIAPLLRPINWVSFAIARWAQKFFTIALKVLVFSIILSILMWAIVSYIAWVDIQTQEIIARSSPNVIDFFIAIFSAMVAVMSLRFTRLWESIAWVAMAASLMPPLAVVWIALAVFNYNLAAWAMMLFLTNLVAIIIVSTIFFWLYWFTPHIEKQQKYMFKRLIFVVISIVIILIPLISTFINIREQHKISDEIRTILLTEISSEVSHFSISNIKIISIKKDKILVKTTVKIPENTDLTSILEKMNTDLSKQLGKTVEIDLEIIRVISITSRK